jgi:hypothetical protein
MASVKISKRFSATFSVDKGPAGWVAVGRIWDIKDGKEVATEVKFRANGNTRQAATNAAMDAARDACPEDEQ